MSTFSIRDLEHLSGIKAHTLRIWEQRYELIKPKRTDTNIRYYDDHDLKLILNVALLKENGIKISKIAEMSDGELQREVLKLTERNLRYPEQIHALTISMVDLDEDRFNKIISSNILKLGFEKTMMNVIYPFLSKIGILWQTSAINPAQVHFISNLVRQKLIAAIDGQYTVT
ncbi:MAG: MerR family transcriptional regulator, partial [Marinoscillum sp.]